MNGLEASYLNDFEKIRQFIEQAKNETASQVNGTIISLYWNIGKFVSEKTQKEGWGTFYGKTAFTIYLIERTWYSRIFSAKYLANEAVL